MIDLAITLLMIAIVIVAFLQPNAPRLFAAVSFISFLLAHEFFMYGYEGLQYYGSAALFDLAIIILTSGINPVPKMVLSLHKICMVSIVANLAGYLLWYYYLPLTAYNATFVVINVWTLIILIKRNNLDVGDYTVDSWSSCFRFNRNPWYVFINKNAGKV